MDTDRESPRIELRPSAKEAQTPAWMAEHEAGRSELDALWERYADRLVTVTLIGHYEQRIEYLEGTPIEHAVEKIDSFFQGLTTPDGQAVEIGLDPTAERFTADDYARLDASALTELARRAFEYLQREATA